MDIFRKGLGENSITQEMLSNAYNYRGIATDIDTTYPQGTYMVVAGTPASVTTYPAEVLSGAGVLKWTLMLIVNNISNRWAIQTFCTLGTASIRYARIVDRYENTYSDWSNAGDTRTLKDKKLVCFGDSITEADVYDNFISAQNVMEVTNVGFGGCRMAYHVDSNYDKFSMTKLADAIAAGVWTDQDAAAATLALQGDDNTAILARLKAIDFSTVNYVTIFYGTNDFGGDVPIGVNTDADSTTYKGAINYIVNKLQTAFPLLKIVFVTPMWRGRIELNDGKDCDTNTNGIGKYLIDYVDAEIEIAKLNKIPVLDLYRTSGINKYTNATYLLDGLHGSTAGCELIGKKIASFLTSNF